MNSDTRSFMPLSPQSKAEVCISSNFVTFGSFPDSTAIARLVQPDTSPETPRVSNKDKAELAIMRSLPCGLLQRYYAQRDIPSRAKSGGLYALYLIGHAIYDIYFHPLRHFPGPKLQAISNIPFLSAWLAGTNVFQIQKLHEKYGDIVRTSPNALSFRDSQAWKDIYGHRTQGQKNMIKDTVFYGPPDTGNDNLLVSSDEDHTRQRRLLAHAFSEKALRDQEPLIGIYVDLLVKRLYDQVDGPTRGKVDMVKWYNFTTFDVIGDLSFGEPFNCLEKDEYHSWVSMVFQGVKGGTFLAAARYYPWISYLVSTFFIPKRLVELREENLTLSAAKVTRRIALGTNRPDFISYILKHNETEKGMARAEIDSNANILIVAGSETIATFLSGCTFYILKHREVYDKLVEVIRSTFRTEADITFSNLQTLPYLDAVVNETLRLYPPVAIGLPRKVPEGGAVLCGHYIPEGKAVSLSQYATYRSENNFYDPNSFLPERWLADPDPKFKNDNRNALQPFSFGPRNCIGRNLANSELRTILARVLWNFDLELCAESNNWAADQKVFTVWEKQPLMVKLIPLRERR
ncbi:hypothetical protein FQN54_008363 [Arachnomyces sp. PD_36]|nr:hypothetical protein FQN54_008363 [Arachnomyces sp. PD_36]